MTTIELLKEYLNMYFVKNCPERMLDLVTEDIHSYGLAGDKVIIGYEEAGKLIQQTDYRQFMKCRIEIWEEEMISEDTAMVAYTLSSQGIDLRYRLFGVSRITPEGRRLYMLQSSRILENQSINTFQDIRENKKSEHQRTRFLESIINGINGNLASYLVDVEGHRTIPVEISDKMGTAQGITKEEYLEKYATNGMDSIYPDDRERVWQSMLDTLEYDSAPSVSFRVLGADGQAHWMNASYARHGEKDGLPMILVLFTPASVQYDLQVRALNQEGTGVAMIDADTREMYFANEAMFHMLGLEAAEYTGKRCPDILHGCGSSCDHCQLHEALEQKTLDKTISVGDKWIAIHAERQDWNEKTVVNVYARDVTEQVYTERYLEARIAVEEKHQLEGGANLLAHFVTNLSKGTVVEHTYQFDERADLLEWSSIEEQKRRTLAYIVKPDKQIRWMDIHNTNGLLKQFAHGKTEESLDYRRLFPNGKIMWVRSVIHLLKDPKTGDILNYEYLYDIHHQKISEELMSAVVSFGFELCASLMLDSDQVTILRSERLHGRSDFDVVTYTKANRAYAETIVEEDRQMYLEACSLRNLAERLKIEDSFEIMHRTLEDGEIHYKKDQCYGYSSDRTTCLLVRSDVTAIVMAEHKKQKELQKALEAAEAATLAKSEFLSRMSHEIRTPMNAIMGMTAIAKENRGDYNQVGECLDKIDMSSRFLLTLINDILEMSRIESGRMEIRHQEFSFNHLIESIRTVVEPLAMKSGLRYEFLNNADTDSYYLGDITRIQQILVNLIANAIKFTRKNGKVRFSVNVDSQTETSTRFRFVVADTGIGMSEEFMKKIFQPFTQEDGSNTSEYGGSGLGLAISRSLVENMGGKIRVESFLGIGSTFTVELPLDRVKCFEQVAEADSQKMETDIALLKDSHILMAEDHPLNVMVARRLLESRGVIVTVAGNGQLAVDAFQTSEPGFYDAILMDIRMPVMDGLDAARTIRSLNRADAKTIPVIAMTANALEEDRQRSREAGMNAHLAKPFEPAELYRVLVHEMERAGRGR